MTKKLLPTVVALTIMTLQVYSQPQVIAHRGAWKNTGLPQNSIASLEAAIDMGCFATECDVWMTADSVLVVNHDPDFYGLPVETSTYGELCKKTHPNGETIPRLEDFVRIIKSRTTTRLVLDVKPSRINKDRGHETVRRVYELVDRMNVHNLVDYIFFDYDACVLLTRLNPDANVAYLNGDKSPSELHAAGLWGLDYHYGVLQRHAGWIPSAKELGLTINVWTVNNEALMKIFIDRGVHFITTDEPELLMRILEK